MINSFAAVGTKSPRSKFTQEQVDDIRSRYMELFETYKEIAAHYKVNPSTIQRIVEFKTYPKDVSAMGRNMARIREDFANKNTPVSQAGAQ
jgi:DNA invertase Pin-like site-specific DNA recombinase